MDDSNYIKAHLRHVAGCGGDSAPPCVDHSHCLEVSHAVGDDVMRELAEALERLLNDPLLQHAVVLSPTTTAPAESALARYNTLMEDS